MGSNKRGRVKEEDRELESAQIKYIEEYFIDA